jgi:hypothetical protein
MDEIEAIMAEIGGTEMVESYRKNLSATEDKPLPHASVDALGVGYSMVVGATACALDLILDNAFRQDMLDKHSEITDDKVQQELEKRVKDKLDELGVKPDVKGQPGMAMDWYAELNEKLGLKPPYRLRPSNHRILNHTDEATIIEMLMKGEAGIGNFVFKIFPEMTKEAAIELLKLHLDADRTSPASLPLKIMAWLWEEGIKAGDPTCVGEPSALFKMLQGMTKNLDWSKWLNKFFGERLIPPGATIGEAMLKLYDTGVLNQRVFWTSDLGAALGGAKRRILVAATMELGVEVFAFLEGIKKGHITWSAGVSEIATQVKAWRDQPKYLDMKMIAQGFASSGGIVRGAMTGDVWQINYFSIGMMIKHLWSYNGTQVRHFDRLIDFSRLDAASIRADFEASTGIPIKPRLSVINGGLHMDSLRARIINAGCHSTRVRVLIQNFPEKMAGIVERYETASKKASGVGQLEAVFDAICESHYLADVNDDAKALKQMESDLAAVEKRLL